MRFDKRMVTGLALVTILLLTLTSPVWSQSPVTRMRNVAIQVLTVSAGLTADDITAIDDMVVGDDLTVSGKATLGEGLTLTPAAVLTVTVNGAITPTSSVQPIAAAGAVGLSGANIAAGNDGDLLILINVGAQTITITETTGLISAGDIALGAGDSATLIYRGTSWYQVGASNN